MMTRAQRIEYEILDCALNRADRIEGFTSTIILFMARLEELFPDIETSEFMKACQELTRHSAIEVVFPAIGGYRRYRDADDDTAFFAAKTLRFSRASSSQTYFQRLWALIEAPTGFKRHS